MRARSAANRRRRRIEQGAAKGFIARRRELQEIDCPLARLPERVLGATENSLAMHHAPHVRIDRRLVAERNVEHPVLELWSADQEAHHPPVIEHDSSRLARDSKLVLDPLDYVARRVLFGHRDVCPSTLRI